MYLKIVLIGDSKCGKSSLLDRLCYNRFKEQFMPTIGAEHSRKTIDVNGEQIRLTIWDNAGDPRSTRFAKALYRKSKGFVVVYDVNNIESFNSITEKINEVR